MFYVTYKRIVNPSLGISCQTRKKKQIDFRSRRSGICIHERDTGTVITELYDLPSKT